MKKKKVAIIGSALSGNKGASAMLESAMQTLNKEFGEKNIEYTLLSMYPKADSEQNTYKNLKIVKASPLELGIVINSWALLHRVLPPLRNKIEEQSEAVKALVEADVLLDQGGITFVDGREKFLLYNVASVLPALNTHTPVVKCAQALGTFKNPINRMVSDIFLPKMKHIVSRGAITHGYLSDLELDNVTEGADYAFLLELEKKDVESAKKKYDVKFFKHDKEVIGVSPSQVMRGKVDKNEEGQYVKTMVEYLNKLHEKGYKTVLIAHSVRSNTDKLHNNDLPLCKEVYAGLEKPEMCLFLDSELSSQELRYFISLCDVFVASRFHAMVSSLAMLVPTLVVGWSHKYKEVLDMFEAGKWALESKHYDTGHLLRATAKLLKNQEELSEKLKKHLPEVKKKSMVQVKLIKKVIEGK